MRTDTDSLSASTVFHVSCFRAPSDSLRLTDGVKPTVRLANLRFGGLQLALRSQI